MAEIKIFGKWGTEGIKVMDPGLVDYVTLTPRMVPKTGARYAKQKFYKSRISIVERLINKLMIPGHLGKKHKLTSYKATGKSNKAYRIVEKTLSIIEQKTRQNPVKILVEAIVNAAPREEIVTIEYGGARYPKATECSPQRRIDVALRHITQGAFQRRFKKKKHAEESLAEEIIAAWQRNSASHAISKKLEIERQADASR